MSALHQRGLLVAAPFAGKPHALLAANSVVNTGAMLLAAASRRRRCVAVGAAASKRTPPPPPSANNNAASRNAGLYELDSASGWSVEAMPDPAAATRRQGGGGGSNAGASTSTKEKKANKKSRGTPFVDLRSPEGVMGLTALQQSLAAEGEDARGAGISSAVSAVQQAASGRRAPRPSALAAAVAAAQRQREQQQQQQQQQGGVFEFDDDEDDEHDEDARTPEFQVTFSPTGETEVYEFDASGRRVPARPPAAALYDDGEGGELEDIGEFVGWDEVDGEDEEEDGNNNNNNGDGDAALLRDLGAADDWGLDGLELSPSAAARARKSGGASSASALEAVLARRAEEDAAFAAAGVSASSVQWGGSGGGGTGIDLDEQEAILNRYFPPQQVAKLMAQQREVEASYVDLRRLRANGGDTDARLHAQLRIAGGTAAGRKLLSSRGAQTRPMMEKVRQAIFSMIQARAGSVSGLPRGSRWLDLFAGTGSVGLEALSRGAGAAHFVEMDSWVVKRVLGKNIASTGFRSAATVHTCKAEDFLRRAAAVPRFAGGAFDFISVCPPYLLVSYPELFGLLEASPLLHSRSIVFAEYPKQLRHEVPDTLGPLERVRDRKYGRTFIAVYAPPGGEGGGEGGDVGERGGNEPEDDPLLAMM